jgi:hypothetical protein
VPYAQVSRQLGDGAPLTVLRFAPLARLRPVLVFTPYNERVSQVQRRRVRFCRCRDNKLEGGDFQEA